MAQETTWRKLQEKKSTGTCRINIHRKQRQFRSDFCSLFVYKFAVYNFAEKKLCEILRNTNNNWTILNRRLYDFFLWEEEHEGDSEMRIKIQDMEIRSRHVEKLANE